MNPEEKSILLRSWLIRVSVGFLAWWITENSNLLLVGDAAYYKAMALQIADEWRWQSSSPTLGVLMEHGTGAWGLMLTLACLFYVVGEAASLFIAIVLLSFVCSMTPVLTSRILDELGVDPADRGRRWAVRLVMYSPIFVFWAGALFKEGLVLLAFNLVCLNVLRLQKAMSLTSLGWVAFGILVVLSNRFYLLGIIVPTTVIGILMARKNTTEATIVRPLPIVILRQVGLIGAFAALITVLGVDDTIRYHLPTNAYHALSRIQSSRDDLARAGSGYLAGVDVSTPRAAMQFLPVGSVYFMSVPFPWEFGSLRQNLVIPEMIVWLGLYFFAFRGMYRGIRRRPQAALYLLAFSAALIVLYALYMGNAGTAYRMRSQVWILWVIFIALGMEESSSTYEEEEEDLAQPSRQLAPSARARLAASQRRRSRL